MTVTKSKARPGRFRFSCDVCGATVYGETVPSRWVFVGEVGKGEDGTLGIEVILCDRCWHQTKRVVSLTHKRTVTIQP